MSKVKGRLNLPKSFGLILMGLCLQIHKKQRNSFFLKVKVMGPEKVDRNISKYYGRNLMKFCVHICTRPRNVGCNFGKDPHGSRVKMKCICTRPRNVGCNFGKDPHGSRVKMKCISYTHRWRNALSECLLVKFMEFICCDNRSAFSM